MFTRPTLTRLVAACALALPLLAHSRPLTLSTQLHDYGGQGAYLAMYLVTPQGQCASTLWVAGRKAKYHKHLSDWKRLCAHASINGITGASVGAGRTLTVKTDLAQALIDAGYEIRIDAADEDMDDGPSEVRLPLRSQPPAAQAGREFIRAASYRWQ